jgi:hypothetical protein
VFNEWPASATAHMRSESPVVHEEGEMEEEKARGAQSLFSAIEDRMGDASREARRVSHECGPLERQSTAVASAPYRR